MDNYEYLIAGLPVLSKDWSENPRLSADELTDEIRSLCSEKDNALIDSLLAGFNDENHNEGFYRRMLKHPDRFLREFFSFDLEMKNCKVRYLNGKLGRPEDTNIFLENEEYDGEEKAEIEKVLNGTDLLQREHGLDSLVWEKVSGLTTFDYFDIDAVLGFLVKLKIIDRWLRLDENEGRALFKRLVYEVRGTFKGVEFNENQK